MGSKIAPAHRTLGKSEFLKLWSDELELHFQEPSRKHLKQLLCERVLGPVWFQQGHAWLTTLFWYQQWLARALHVIVLPRVKPSLAQGGTQERW